MKNWILLFQTPYDTVKYITSELNTTRSLSYYKFLDYVSSFFVVDYYNFKLELNKYKTILINMDDHTWRIYEEDKKEATRKELLELNKEEDTKENKIDKFKNFLRKFKREESLKRIVNIDDYDSRNSDTRVPRVRI